MTAAGSLPAPQRTLMRMVHASTAYQLHKHSAFRKELLTCALGPSVMLGQGPKNARLHACKSKHTSARGPVCTVAMLLHAQHAILEASMVLLQGSSPVRQGPE